ncbi:hypothetical protein RB595_006326 [Gaeumannomyces hyphopodioides]
MSSTGTAVDYNDLDRYQDELGQLPQIQSYSQALYYFPHQQDVSRDAIVEKITRAVAQIRAKVPWMGARVICVGKGEGSSGHYRVIPVAPPEPAIDITDLTDASPSYAEIRERKAPLSMIVANAKRVSPVPGYPHRFEVDRDDDPAHCVRLQVSFVRGGVLLSFSIMHTMADAGGMFAYINMVAMGMRGEAIPASLLACVNMDRRGAVPLLTGKDPKEPAPLDHSHHLRKPLTPWDPLVPRQAARNHVFRFTATAMAAIKDLTGAPGAEGWDPAVAFISTDDALSAFCWQRFILARTRRRGGFALPADTRSQFTRQMDGRRLVGLPTDYAAVVSHTARVTLTFAEVATGPLAAVACALRVALNAANTAQHLRSMATFVAGTADRSAITYAGDFDPDRDVGTSSTRSLEKKAFPDFGPLLGTPEFYRRPPSMPFPATVVFLPSTEGGCDADACVTDEDFETLMADPEWTKYVEHIG